MISNVGVYLTIAEDALAEAQRLNSLARTPRPDGQPGSVIAYDSQQKSFKQSLIALVFAGVYLEALLYLVGVTEFGKNKYLNNIDRGCYENKLQHLGISDAKTLSDCKRFRAARKDVVHEKAVKAADIKRQGGSKILWAQKEAEHGMLFVKRVAALLKKAP